MLSIFGAVGRIDPWLVLPDAKIAELMGRPGQDTRGSGRIETVEFVRANLPGFADDENVFRPPNGQRGGICFG